MHSGYRTHRSVNWRVCFHFLLYLGHPDDRRTPPPRRRRAQSPAHRRARPRPCSPSAASTSRSRTSPPRPEWGSGRSTGASRTASRSSRRVFESSSSASSRPRATRWRSRIRGRRSGRSCMTVARMHARDRGLKDVLSSDRGRERVAGVPRAPSSRSRGSCSSARRPRARCARTSRTFDIPMIHQAVSAIADITRDVSPDYFERTLTLLHRRPRPRARRRRRCLPRRSMSSSSTTIMSRHRR